MPAWMYHEVLVPTDGSATAEAAVRHAIELAILNDARLHVLYVVDVGGARIGSRQDDVWAPVVQAVRDQGKRHTGEVVKSAREAGLEALQAVEEDDSPAQGVLDYVDEHGIEAIVVGTHGRSGPKRWLLGSVTERIVRGSPVPVLVVPPADA